jgi:hypothetical protein
MENKGSEIKYFAYVRKSSEGQERQALSIPAQKEKLLKTFPDLDIEFVSEKVPSSPITVRTLPRCLSVLTEVSEGA